jgi:hypothetical protein
MNADTNNSILKKNRNMNINTNTKTRKRSRKNMRPYRPVENYTKYNYVFPLKGSTNRAPVENRTTPQRIKFETNVPVREYEVPEGSFQVHQGEKESTSYGWRHKKARDPSLEARPYRHSPYYQEIAEVAAKIVAKHSTRKAMLNAVPTDESLIRMLEGYMNRIKNSGKFPEDALPILRREWHKKITEDIRGILNRQRRTNSGPVYVYNLNDENAGAAGSAAEKY